MPITFVGGPDEQRRTIPRGIASIAVAVAFTNEDGSESSIEFDTRDSRFVISGQPFAPNLALALAIVDLVKEDIKYGKDRRDLRARRLAKAGYNLNGTTTNEPGPSKNDD